MELKISKRKKEERIKTPHYILRIDFMEGDADDYHHEEIFIEPEKLDEYKSLILAIECCTSCYPNGRGGYDEYNGLLEYDAFFGYDGINFENYDPVDFDLDENISDEDFQNFLEKKVKEINPLELEIHHPCESNSGIYDSFDGYELLYYDENGDSYSVNITFSEEEKERINYCKVKFR